MSLSTRVSPEDQDPRFRVVGEKLGGASKGGRCFINVHRRIAPLTEDEEKSFSECLRRVRSPEYLAPYHSSK